jgi:hypothetical protein
MRGLGCRKAGAAVNARDRYLYAANPCGVGRALLHAGKSWIEVATARAYLGLSFSAAELMQ